MAVIGKSSLFILIQTEKTTVIQRHFSFSEYNLHFQGSAQRRVEWMF